MVQKTVSAILRIFLIQVYIVNISWEILILQMC